jgi:hypothetical protein
MNVRLPDSYLLAPFDVDFIDRNRHKLSTSPYKNVQFGRRMPRLVCQYRKVRIFNIPANPERDALRRGLWGFFKNSNIPGFGPVNAHAFFLGGVIL